MDVPIVCDLDAGVAQKLRDDLHLHAAGVQVAGEGVPECVQPPVLHARCLAGRLHRGQQVPIAQVLAGLGGEHVGATEDHLSFLVPNGLPWLYN